MMQEGLDDGPDFLSEEDRAPRAINVDLQPDATLQVDISDALSERDKVKFTVHTKSSLPNFKQNEFSVVRQHEEFIWLHDSFVESEDYAGYIIPPAPPRPDFDASREKLQKLGQGEGSMTREEFTKMKPELEALKTDYIKCHKTSINWHLRKTAWIHCYLGIGNRRPIPSCVVRKVCAAFPDLDGEYMGYLPCSDTPTEFMAFEW